MSLPDLFRSKSQLFYNRISGLSTATISGNPLFALLFISLNNYLYKQNGFPEIALVILVLLRSYRRTDAPDKTENSGPHIQAAALDYGRITRQ